MEFSLSHSIFGKFESDQLILGAERRQTWGQESNFWSDKGIREISTCAEASWGYRVVIWGVQQARNIGIKRKPKQSPAATWGVQIHSGDNSEGGQGQRIYDSLWKELKEAGTLPCCSAELGVRFLGRWVQLLKKYGNKPAQVPALWDVTVSWESGGGWAEMMNKACARNTKSNWKTHREAKMSLWTTIRGL